MKAHFWLNPMFYGSLGFILVAVPCLYYFFMGISGTMVTQTGFADGNSSVVVETVRQGAFNPFLLIFIIGAGVAAYGCYRNPRMAWAGSDCGLFHVLTDEERPIFAASLFSALIPGGKYFMLCFSEHEPGSFGPRRVTQAVI